MIPPRDVGFEVSHQLIGCRKVVRFLQPFRVPMVTLPPFIIVEQHAFTTNDVRKAVLESMRGRQNRFRNLPDCHIDKCVGSDNNPSAKQGYCLHVGQNTNTQRRCQLLQRKGGHDLTPHERAAETWLAGSSIPNAP